MSRKSETLQHISGRQVFSTYLEAVRPYRWYFFIIILAIILSSALGVIQPLYYKMFFDILEAGTDKQRVAPELFGTIYIVLLINAIAWLSQRIAHLLNNHFQARIMANLRQHAFNYMIDHSYTFFANNFTGSLVQRVNRFAYAFEHLADRIIWTITPLFIRLGGIIIITWFISPWISLVLLGWVVVFVTFNYYFSKWKLKYQIRSVEADSKTTGTLSDAITNQNAIQMFTGADRERAYFQEVTEEQARITRFNWNVDTIVDSGQALLQILVEFFLFFVAIRLWINGTVSLGTFVLLQAYIISLIGTFWDFSRVVRDFYSSMANAKEMVEILEMQHEIRNILGARTLEVTRGEIAYEHVFFRFNESRNILDGIHLNIKSGEKIALVGPSGAGKSTIVRLLLRLYEITDGYIKIDGTDIRQVTQESLRENLSLVPQDPVLFHRTLMENIRYGRPSATDEEVKRAAKLAHCDEFIDALPNTYHTFVGERGIKLSGGERQRVAIARAILKNAPILILDEATSSLDSHSEFLIQDALDSLMKGKTTIVIAHRLSTIRKMDRIIVVDEGRIVEQGTHDELSRTTGGLYHKLWSLQAGGFIPDEESDTEKLSGTPALLSE